MYNCFYVLWNLSLTVVVTCNVSGLMVLLFNKFDLIWPSSDSSVRSCTNDDGQCRVSVRARIFTLCACHSVSSTLLSGKRQRNSSTICVTAIQLLLLRLVPPTWTLLTVYRRSRGKGRKSVYGIARKLQKNCSCTYVPNSCGKIKWQNIAEKNIENDNDNYMHMYTFLCFIHGQIKWWWLLL